MAFYKEKLAFEVISYSEEDEWVKLRREEVELMLSTPNDHIDFESSQMTGSIYIYTDRVDMLYEEFKDIVKLAYPIENFHYGMREFAIYDNNGYMLQFGQPVSGL